VASLVAGANQSDRHPPQGEVDTLLGRVLTSVRRRPTVYEHPLTAVFGRVLDAAERGLQTPPPRR